MADPEKDDLRDIATLLAQSTRELNDAATRIADAIHSQANTSNVTINAGGISAGIAIGMGGVALAVMFLVSIWMMMGLAQVRSELATTRQDLQDQQAAWVGVMQQKVNEVKK